MRPAGCEVVFTSTVRHLSFGPGDASQNYKLGVRSVSLRPFFPMFLIPFCNIERIGEVGATADAASPSISAWLEAVFQDGIDGFSWANMEHLNEDRAFYFTQWPDCSHPQILNQDEDATTAAGML